MGVGIPAGRGSVWLDHPAVQRSSQEDAEAAEHDERPAPPVMLADETGEEAARDGADVDAGLMESERARAGFGPVVITQQGHGGGGVECLAPAFGAAEEIQRPQSARERRG